MKNVIILKNRDFNFYDFNEIKKNNNIRLSLITFNDTFNCLSEEIKRTVDKIYVLDNITSLFDSPLPIEKVQKIVENEIQYFNNTWLVGADELNIITASILREKHNLIGLPYSIALNYRDKIRQKKILGNKGIRIPRFVPVQKKLHSKENKIIYSQLVEKLTAPFILKPNSMGGSTGVEKIESFSQFTNYFLKFSHFTDFIAEEFIEGKLFHCDFILQENKYIFAEVAKYFYNGLAFIEGYNHGSLLLLPHDPLRGSIIDFCIEANRILGLKSGCTHFEVFISPEKEIIFLEAAARPGGSMVPQVFSKTFKKNYMNAALYAEIQENPGNFNIPDQYYFWTFFSKKSGIIKSLNPPILKSSYKLNWLIKIGDKLENPSSISDKSGFLLAKNTNYEVLKNDFEFLKNFNPLISIENPIN